MVCIKEKSWSPREEDSGGLNNVSIRHMTFALYTFHQLSAKALYEILDLRNQVFVVEQNCVYLDTDGKDFLAYHLLLKVDGVLSAYCRILPKGLAYQDYVSIGRVVTSSGGRTKGYGRKLMAEALTQTEKLFPKENIKIEAQSYLIPFYESFGFECVGVDYILDGIPHREMIRMSKL